MLLLAACAPRMAFLPVTGSAGPGEAPGVEQRIYLMAADRAVPGLRSQDGGGIVAAGLDVAIPADRSPGTVRYVPADPSRSFAIARASDLGTMANLADAALRERENGQSVFVFVHGYNNTAAEAVFRHAQIAHDFGGSEAGPQITFHWPSVARASGYVADRDAALAARGDLEELLLQLTDRAPGRVVLVAHSMGAFLSMETLMRMAVDRPGAMNRLDAVVLFSPDISMSVFEAQLDRIGDLPEQFVVTTSQADRILGLSARLAGQTERLGALRDGDVLRARGVAVVDLTSFAAEGNAHLTAATSPAAISLLRGLGGSGGLRDRTLLSGLGGL